ncbi:glycosyltransferase [Flexibacterium corallicola]|uniref:glycosyltransferase n=1 Tax=Flexibacterium corallicola TaxID=3037259 RepID=UPI00286EE69C|nr:glycosyltransferase [Pseudovibrio sp. M1P-2-3]
MTDRQKVLWVNSIGMRRPQPTIRDFKRVLEKASSFLHTKKNNIRDPIDNHSNISVCSMKIIPWPGNSRVRQINKILLGKQLRSKKKELNLSHPILWTSLPTAVVALGELEEYAVVYYCGDDFGSLAGVDHGPVLSMEKELASKADLIIAASENLTKRFPADKTVHIPHGVDFELFSSPQGRPNDLPDGPVAGFYGSIAEWVDLESIAIAADELPHWNFVLIGNVECAATTLQNKSNIFLLGPRPHHLLPAYLQHFDVSLLPFRDNDQIRACNPLKLREYLAAGNPIVSTRFPALQPYEKLLTTIPSGDQLAAGIREADADTFRNTQRQQAVQPESWTARSHRITQLINEL